MREGVLDLETKNWNEVFLVGAKLGEEIKFFKKVNEFIEWLVEVKDNVIFYAHNGGGFDFKFVWVALFLNGYKPYKVIERGGKIICFRVRFHKNNFIEFRDSYAILPSSLRRLAKSFKVDTQKGEIDYLNETDAEVWKDYNAKDLIALEQVIAKYKSLLGVSKLEITVASQAMKDLRSTFPFKFEFQKGENEVRLGYYGGRVEIFNTHGLDLKCYDVNSLFPFVMKKFEYPFGEYGISTEFGHGIWNAKVKAPDVDIPLLPVRLNGKLFFPTGSFSGWWTYPELVKAEKEGYEVEILRGLACDEIKRPFVPFVDKWYERKVNAELEGDESMRYVSKLMMNSSYGKLGQRRERSTITAVEEFEEGDCVIDENFMLVERKSVNYFSDFVNPMVAAYVTGYARMHLFDLLKACDGDVAYCDTDSVYTGKTLPTSHELGGLKLEMELSESKFILPKLSTHKDIDGNYIIKCKGLPKKQQGRVYKEFERVLDAKTVHEGGKIDTLVESLVGWRESFRRGLPLTAVIERHRVVNQTYDKRKVLENGQTKPYDFNELEKSLKGTSD